MAAVFAVVYPQAVQLLALIYGQLGAVPILVRHAHALPGQARADQARIPVINMRIALAQQIMRGV